MTPLLLAAALCGQAYCAPARAAAPAYHAAPSYQAPSYAAPSYGQGYGRGYYDQLYLGYPKDAAVYAGFMAQQQRATAAEKERETILAALAAIKGYLAGSPGRPSEAAPAPPTPGKTPPAPDPAPPDPSARFGAGSPAPDDAAPPPPPVPAASPGLLVPPAPAPAGPTKTGSVAPPPAATLSVLQNRCAKCHTGESADGGGFALFKAPGVPDDLSPLDVDLVEKRVRAGTMPPMGAGGRLGAAERAAVTLWADANAGAIARALASARQASR